MLQCIVLPWFFCFFFEQLFFLFDIVKLKTVLQSNRFEFIDNHLWWKIDHKHKYKKNYKKVNFSYPGMIYIIGKLISCALRICHCFWAWGSFQPVELVHENGLEKWIFWLFSTYMFLESWDQACNESVGIFKIRGHLRPWEVIKGHQRSNLKNNRT